MITDKDINQSKNFPSVINQFQNNTPQIINYYINLSENLNMNNNINAQIQNIPINLNLSNPPFENQILNNILNNGVFLNALMNVRNYFASIQVQSTNQQNLQKINVLEKDKKLKEKENLVGKKKKREENCEENSKKSIQINKNININEKEKNGNFFKNTTKEEVVKSNNSITNSESNETFKSINGKNVNLIQSPINENIFEKKSEFEQNLLESGKNEKKNINLGHIKKGNKINRYKELLQDTLLENLDKSKGGISIIIKNEEFEQPKRVKLNKKSFFKKTNKVINKLNKAKKNYKKSNKCHFSYNKNSKNEISFHPTKCIFHGDNYEKTNSPYDFMKYNYNYIEEKKQVNKTENKIDDLSKIINRNNNENKYNLSDIKPIWLRSEFKGNDMELKNCINLIKKEYKEKRDEKEEEECLKKIFENKKNINIINK